MNGLYFDALICRLSLEVDELGDILILEAQQKRGLIVFF